MSEIRAAQIVLFYLSRGQFLELTIVLILVFELVLIFLGVMQ